MVSSSGYTAAMDELEIEQKSQTQEVGMKILLNDDACSNINLDQPLMPIIVGELPWYEPCQMLSQMLFRANTSWDPCPPYIFH